MRNWSIFMHCEPIALHVNLREKGCQAKKVSVIYSVGKGNTGFFFCIGYMYVDSNIVTVLRKLDEPIKDTGTYKKLTHISVLYLKRRVRNWTSLTAGFLVT